MSYASLIKSLGLANVASATVAVMFAATEVRAAVAVQPAALPSTPVVGALAVDSGDSNKLKWYDGTAWQAAGAGSGGGIGGSIAANQVALGNGTNTVAGSAEVTYTNNGLKVTRTDNGAAFFEARNMTVGTVAVARFDAYSDTVTTGISATGSGYGNNILGISGASHSVFFASRNIVVYSAGNYPIRFGTNNLERLRIYEDGGVQIGGTYGTSPGAGVLQLTGNTFSHVAANPGGTTTLWVDSANEHLMFGATDLSAGGGGAPYLAQNEIGFGSSTNELTSVPWFTITGTVIQASFLSDGGGAVLTMMQNTAGNGWGGFQAVGENTYLQVASYGSGVANGWENESQMPVGNTSVVSSNLRLLVTGSEIYTMSGGNAASRMFNTGGIIFGAFGDINPTNPPTIGVVVASGGLATGPSYEHGTTPIWSLGGAYAGTPSGTSYYIEVYINGQLLQIPAYTNV
jgi:hypothetical protein